jgi:hypothetical protein
MGAMVSSSMPLVDRDVVVIRVLDHRHAADRCVEGFRDERHRPRLILCTKASKSDTSKATMAPYLLS